MANPVWPLNLPKTFPLGTGENFADGRLRTDMDAGLPKLRRRYTAAIRVYELRDDRFVFDEDQKDTLQTFWDTDLKGGTLEFDWPNPWPNETSATFRFRDTPRFVPIMPGPNRKFTVQFTLERLP